MERIQKFLSRAGVASRRAAEKMMLEGRVSVNGDIVMEMGTKIDPENDRVEVDGRRVRAPQQLAYYIVNKPRGYICSLDDPKGRPIITDLLPKRAPRVWPVGRLDWDSEGVIVLTNDGDLTQLLTHPKHDIEKTYAVKVKGVLEKDDPAFELFLEGLRDSESRKPMTAKAAHLFKTTQKNSWIEVVLTEGQNRQIRRMCTAVGWDVMRLRRLVVAGLTLKGVNQGDSRKLDPSEVVKLYQRLNTDAPDELHLAAKEAAKEKKKRKKR